MFEGEKQGLDGEKERWRAEKIMRIEKNSWRMLKDEKILPIWFSYIISNVFRYFNRKQNQ